MRGGWRRKLGGAEASGKGWTGCWAVQALVGCAMTLKWRTWRRWWASTTRTKRTRSCTVGTVKKSTATRSGTWFVRNVRHVCEGGVRRFGISRETERAAKSMPSLSSSRWIRGAPNKGFVAAILLMRAVVSALIGGRPSRGRPESPVQCSRKRRLCHRRTVFGDTMTRACLQAGPDCGQPDPQEAIGRAQPGPRHRSFVYDELLAQSEVLQGELAVATGEEGKEPKQGGRERDHQTEIVAGSEPTDQPLARRAEFWRGTPAGGTHEALQLPLPHPVPGGPAVLRHHPSCDGRA